ncbi:MAG TPA: methyltransferase domain-containing protein [Chloroflexota bacterium]|jgi:SAM-dependent methyltransferase
MPDVYATITEAEPAVLERLVGALELRAAHPQQRAMLESYLAEVPFPPAARVLEIGCGSGAISRALARWPGVDTVIGVDPSPYFVAKARELSAGVASITFEPQDGRALRFPDGTFDVVVVHTVLCHIPEPERVLAEAHRVLRPGGSLAIFDGDYATTTLATGEFDPLQACAEAAMAGLVHDRWLIRRLRTLVAAAGFEIASFRSHGFVETDPEYMMTLVERGADFLSVWGRISEQLAAALKAEACRRAEAGSFFGHIAYTSIMARKRA